MSKERRYILIAGAVLVMIGLIYRFYPDLQDSLSLEKDIARKEKQLAKYRLMMEERNRLESNLSGLENQLKTAEKGLLTGETPTIAAVDIQNTLDEIAGRTEIEIKTMQVMKPHLRKNEAYLEVPVQVSIETNASGLKNILYGIRTSSKRLYVSDMKIRTDRLGRTDRIQATFTVTGYMKKEGSGI